MREGGLESRYIGWVSEYIDRMDLEGVLLAGVKV